MTFKRFKQIIDNNDVSLLRERIIEISTGGWQKISREMTFTLDEIREFADHIDWDIYSRRWGWFGMRTHLEFADRITPEEEILF